MNNKARFNELLISTNRPGIDELIKNLEKMGFYTCPCSSQYHLAKQGGLVEHSLNVCDTALKCAEFLGAGVERNSVIIAALLHDIGKVGDHNKPAYIFTGNVGKPYKSNADLKYIPHEVRSIVIANRYIQLTEDEQYAIYYHNGKYTNIGETLKQYNPLEMILHFADMYSCFEIEK